MPIRTLHLNGPLAAPLLVFAISVPLLAAVIDFEGFTDGTLLTNQYPGLTFSNTIVLASGVSLNEFEFPPRSGNNVASDENGPIRISFNPPVQGFSGYFTYSAPVTLTAFDSTNRQVGTAASLFSINEALSGDPGSSPDELIQVSATTPVISSLTIAGAPGGQSFTLDDVSLSAVQTQPSPPAAPAPSSFLLSITGFALFAWIFRKRLSAGRFDAVGGAILILLSAAAVSTLISFPAFAQNRSGARFSAVAIQKPTISHGPGAQVVVTSRLAQSTYIPESINLIGYRPMGAPIILGRLTADPQIDSRASSYSVRLPLPDVGAGVTQLGVSAAIRGRVRRVVSQTVPLKR
jgi:hypothetical protein